MPTMEDLKVHITATVQPLDKFLDGYADLRFSPPSGCSIASIESAIKNIGHPLVNSVRVDDGDDATIVVRCRIPSDQAFHFGKLWLHICRVMMDDCDKD